MAFNQLNDSQAERMEVLNGELAEAIGALSKIKRHGRDSRWPPETGPTNIDALERELGDVLAAVSRMDRAGELSFMRICDYAAQKHATIKPWLHHDDLP